MPEASLLTTIYSYTSQYTLCIFISHHFLPVQHRHLSPFFLQKGLALHGIYRYSRHQRTAIGITSQTVDKRNTIRGRDRISSIKTIGGIQVFDCGHHFDASTFSAYSLKSKATRSESVAVGLRPYALSTSASRCVWAFTRSGGIVSGS